MSTIEIDGLKLHYEEYGNAGRDVVLLHGWGQNTEMMAFIGEHLKDHFHVYNIDFPGFGQSEEPKETWGCEDYTAFLRDFLSEKGVEEPIFIAHSFGCRIALRYAYLYPVRKMVLTGAAGLRDKRGLDWYLRTYTYKAGKKIMSIGPLKQYQEKLANKAGSEDYRNATGIMRSTFVKVVNDDVRDLLPSIDTETLLVFGEKDEATPVEKGKEMEKLMGNATLVTFAGDDHYAYFHQPVRFNLVLDAFLKEDYV